MITILFLLASGILGIATDVLMKIDSINQKGGAFNFKTFAQKEWASIGISICVVLAVLIGRESIKELYQAGKVLFLAYYGIGLAAQTVVYFIRKKIVGITGEVEGGAL